MTHQDDSERRRLYENRLADRREGRTGGRSRSGRGSRTSTNSTPVDPPTAFVEQANFGAEDLREFEGNWPGCWENAASLIDWKTEYDAVLESTNAPPYFRWFGGGQLNASSNCVDRHVHNGRGSNSAIVSFDQHGNTIRYTYEDLYAEVNAFAAALRELGVEADDAVTLCLPNVPELVVSMLACARIGAPHVVVSPDYSSKLLSQFREDAESEYLVARDSSTPEHSIPSTLEEDIYVSARSGGGSVDSDTQKYSDLVNEHRGIDIEPVARRSDDTLFINHTSRSECEQIGIQHTLGGYLSFVTWTTRSVLDVNPDDTYWCTAGLEWMTGHSYVVYGPLSRGATIVLSDGGAGAAKRNRPWETIEQQEVTHYYTTPTAIRTFKDQDREGPQRYDLSSLRLLGTVGERINPETWWWFYRQVGGGTCPVVDTLSQAETGGIVATTLPGVHSMKPGAVGPALPGIDATVVDANYRPVTSGEAGYLVITQPWPGMFRPLHADNSHADGYWSGFSESPEQWMYFSKDGATVDEEGYITILGRLDDVINVGHLSKNRIDTGEIQEVILETDGISDAAVIRGNHELKGDSPYAFVVPIETGLADDLRARVCKRVEEQIAPFARPENVFITSELPKTNTGQVLHHALKDLLDDEPLGNTSLVRNPRILDSIATEIRQREEKIEKKR